MWSAELFSFTHNLFRRGSTWTKCDMGQLLTILTSLLALFVLVMVSKLLDAIA
jgi:hypothetical protein